MSLLLALAGGGGGGSVSGSIAWTEAGETLAVSGSLSVTLANAWTEGGDNHAVVGNVKLTLSNAWTEQGETLAVNGLLTVTAGNAWTEGSETPAILAAVTVSGSIAYTESDDLVAITGSVSSGVSAVISWTEGGETVSISTHVDVAFAQLPRLPLDPMLPISNDVGLMVTRVLQVYRVIAVFHNTVTQSVSGSFEQLPLTHGVPSTLHGLLIAWNDLHRQIVKRHNQVSGAVTGQAMADSFMVNAPTVQSFRTQFYDQYRNITRNYNALAETIDTLNGY